MGNLLHFLFQRRRGEDGTDSVAQGDVEALLGKACREETRPRRLRPGPIGKRHGDVGLRSEVVNKIEFRRREREKAVQNNRARGRGLRRPQSLVSQGSGADRELIFDVVCDSSQVGWQRDFLKLSDERAAESREFRGGAEGREIALSDQEMEQGFRGILKRSKWREILRQREDAVGTNGKMPAGQFVADMFCERRCWCEQRGRGIGEKTVESGA